MTPNYLVRPESIPARAAWPVIDAHNHLWAKWDSLANVVKVMDEVGVSAYCDLTSNVTIQWGGGGYLLSAGKIENFFANTASHLGRFYGFTMAEFAQPVFDDTFAERCCATLREHVRLGARGLKVLKELGLHYRDEAGKLIACDDDRLAPVWAEAGKLGVPVLVHQADPYGFFQPVTPENEHYGTLQKYPAWSFVDVEKFPRFEELQRRYRNLIRSHPHTTFLLPHVANWPENLDYIGQLLDECPNAYIDFSARLDELGRQPYRAREFFLRYQDRIYFGSDMPASVEMYRCYFRFLETYDEHFVPPDYDGTFGRYRWHIHGIGLPKDVLAKIYYKNALKLIPKLKEELAL